MAKVIEFKNKKVLNDLDDIIRIIKENMQNNNITF
jgi:hypothetical protein